MAKVEATAETQPVAHSGDAADDPAIWVDPRQPGKSLIIGNDKQGALETYNLDGSLNQRLTSATTSWGNVDVRQGVRLGGATLDVVAAANGGLRLFSVDPATRRLASLTPGVDALDTDYGEGLCLYDGGERGLFVFMVSRDGSVRQFRFVTGASGKVSIDRVREFEVGSESEGCVVDDANHALYISEEGVGLWRYGADPATGDRREMIDEVLPHGHQTEDIEGVTLTVSGPDSGSIITSSQGTKDQTSYFSVFDRRTGGYLSSFRIVDGPAADGCSHTDGVTATAQSLGSRYPQGVFVCQDDANTAPGSSGAQNFKLTRLETVLEAP